MSFFQNPFTAEFKGHWPLRSSGDGKQQSLILDGNGNSGRGDDLVMSWAGVGPFDLSGNDADGTAKRYLSVKFTSNFTHWSVLRFDLTAGAALTVTALVSTLNADANFTSFFTAASSNGILTFRQRLPVGRFRFFVVNGGAETVLKFNARAGVFEMPEYFVRHIIGGDETDCLHTLVQLDPTNNDVDADVIDDAVDHKGNSLGYDSSNVKEEWEFLSGSSGIFQFRKHTVDGSNRITQSIVYPAGSGVGDLAVKTVYTFTSANTVPTTVFEMPYTLQSGDLITPP
jgi:hypothetical protein